MRKLFFFMCMMLMGPVWGSGQVIIHPQIPFTGVQLKSQLWNFSIVNMGSTGINVTIEMTFTDASNGQRIFTATSRLVSLQQQVNVLQAQDLNPIVYNILHTGYNIDNSQDGFLPVGQYEVCFAVLQAIGENNEKIAEACEAVEVEPISPPLLVFPENETVTDLTRPLFTWIPPAPVSNFVNLSYNWALVEVTGNQTGADAIDQNLPLHSQTGLTYNFFAYPASLPVLDSSKLYAWQVSAVSANNAISKSEVWTFRTRLYALDTANVITRGFFSPVKKIEEASYITTTGKIRIEYLNEIADTTASVHFYDLSVDHRNRINQLPILTAIKPGTNYLVIDFDLVQGIQDDHFYLLELVNSRLEKWYIKFQYKIPDSN